MGIAVLGRLAIDESADRLGPRDRVVLSTLAMWAGEVVSADRLADALWRDQPPTTWAKVVQGCIMRLRKVLGSAAIETTPHGYRLVLPSDGIDARRFERLVRRGRELLALGEPERAAYVLGEAMSLWRGPAFPELDGWETGSGERERLEELRRDAEELAVEAGLRAGRAREVIAQAQALVSRAPLRERRWTLLAMAQYRAGRQSEALRTLRDVRRLVATELGLDPDPEVAALEEAFLRQDPALLATAPPPELSPTCPYPGLVPYDVADADAFHGRDTDIAQCLRRLAETGVLVVAGPSGSGKSSLVRAGVAAALVRDGRPLVVITPGAHPVDALTAIPSRGRRPVLLVDQVEEVVALCPDTAQRAEFFRALVTHAESAPLIVAVRADHLSELAAHSEFARLAERGLHLLGDMDGDQLRACIEEPARQAGLLLEPGLVDLLVREVEGEPGALPLLSHALRQTWGRREGRTLTVEGYVATGGIQEAVARTAEDVWFRTRPEHKELVRDLVLRLVVPTPEGDPVRNRMPRRLVASDTEREQVIEQLVTARLVTSDDGVLVLAHEAVVRAWPRLRQWLEEDKEGQRILHHLPGAADTWESMGRPDSELYRGSRLAQAVEWRDRTKPSLSSVEAAFLDASTAFANAELEAARGRAVREARARRRTGRLAAGLAAALVLTIVAAATATYFQRSASQRADQATAANLEADANRLAALSRSVGSLDLSLLLAVRAARMADTAATQDALLSTLVRHRRATRVVQLTGQATDMELAAGGRVMFVSRHTGVLSWEMDDALPPTPVNDWDQPRDIAATQSGDAVALWGWKSWGRMRVGVFGHDGRLKMELVGDRIGGWPETFGFRPDGSRLLMSITQERQGGHKLVSLVREVEVPSGRNVRTFRTGLTSDDAWLTGKIADDGSSAVVWTLTEQAPRARLVDLDTGSSAPIRIRERAASSVGFLPLSTGVAQRWSDGAITLYDRSGRATQVLDAHQAEVNDVVVSPDHDWAASADDAGAVIIWTIDPSTGTWSQRESLVGHSGAVNGVAVHPSGTTLVTASRDGTAITWDLSPGAGFGSPVPGLRDRWISNAPRTVVPGELVVAPSRPAPPAGTALLGAEGTDLSVFTTFLDPDTGNVVADLRVAGRTVGFNGSSVAVSPDRERVAVTHGFGVTVLDTRTREVLARFRMPVLHGDGTHGPDTREVVWCSAWSPDGSRLLLCADGWNTNPDDGNILVLDTTTWEPATARIPIGGSAQAIELSADGRFYALGMHPGAIDDPRPGEVKLVDAESREVVRTLTMGAGDQPFDVTFSSDSTMLATGGGQGRVAVFDVATGRLLHAPDQVHNDLLNQVEWLPDNRTVVSTGMDGVVSLYDAQRGLLRAVLPASAEADRRYAFLMTLSEGEVTAVAGGAPGRRYTLDRRRWLDYACAVAGRDLTRDEWSSFAADRPYERTCGSAQVTGTTGALAGP